MKEYLQSNTVRVASLTILGAATAYVSGQVDEKGAVLLILTGIIQLIQRTAKIKKENQEPTRTIPRDYPDVDGGGPGVTGS